MKGERSFFFLLFFFLLLALVIAALRHFPLMLAPRYTRCCRLALLRGRGMPVARPPRHGEGIWGITSLHGSAWSTSRASSSRFALRLVPCRLSSNPGGLFSPCMVPFRVLHITHPHAAPSSAAGARTPEVPPQQHKATFSFKPTQNTASCAVHIPWLRQGASSELLHGQEVACARSFSASIPAGCSVTTKRGETPDNRSCFSGARAPAPLQRRVYK